MAATARGIDVSNHQTAQDWKAIAAGGVTFAFIKASEGTHTHDARYRMHMDGILSVASLLPGAYHYAWPNQDPKAEADNYIAAVKSDADRHPGFVHWLDQERREDGKNYAGVNNAEIRAYAAAWVARVKAAFPRQRVGVYASGSDITAAHYPSNSDALWYPAYPAGAMSYTAAEQRTRPAPGGITALFWQFTSTPIDRSIAYMTPAALRSWAGGDDMPLTPADAKLVAGEVFELMTSPAGRDRMAMAVMWALDKALDTSKLDAKSDTSGVVTQIEALRPKLKALAGGGGALSDAQAAAGFAALAADPKFAKAMADALGADLAARLQS